MVLCLLVNTVYMAQATLPDPLPGRGRFGLLSVAEDRTVVGAFFSEPLTSAGCDSCLKCAEVCPVGALVGKGS